MKHKFYLWCCRIRLFLCLFFVSPLFDKTMDGFGELFRMKSYEQVKTAVLLSRATAGLVNGAAVFCIPGSPKAVQLAAEEIIVPEIKHILTHAGQ